MFTVEAVAQKKPARHLDAEFEMHAKARQEPAGHATHAALDVALVPPALKVPGGQAVAVAEPRGQKWPAGQGACCVFATVAVAQTYPAEQAEAAPRSCVLPVARQKPGVQASEPVAVTEAVPVAGALSVNWLPTVPSPPDTRVVPAGMLRPVTYMPARSVPEVIPLTVSTVEPAVMEAVTTGREAPATVPDTAPVVGVLSVHRQGNELVEEQLPATITVPAAKPAFVTVMPITSEPDATALTDSVVEPPAAVAVTLAAENVGAKPRRAGQKKPAGQAT